MSGHSKWSTIKRKKEATDQARGKVFSKLSRAISIAVKTGGGSNPDSNHKLSVAIEAARAANMPKVNVERALNKAASEGNLEEITYEGFGPEGINVIVEVASDNRNRTGQEIKGIFDRGGGRLAGPGAVSFNFEPKSFFVVKKSKNSEKQILNIIDLGAEDVEETDDAIEVYAASGSFSKFKEKLESSNFQLLSAELMQKPINLHTIKDRDKASKTLMFLEKLEGHDDVQKVFADLDVPDEVLSN